MVAVIHSQLQTLPITSRLCPHFIDLAPLLSLCGEAVLSDYQYRRLLSFSFANLSDLVSRLEYLLRSVWTLYFVLLASGLAESPFAVAWTLRSLAVSALEID